MTKSITIRGVTYPTASAAALACGVTVSAISQAAKRGGLEKVGLKVPRRAAVPVTVRGVTYPSQTVAACALGITVASVNAAYKQDRLDGVGLRVAPQLKAPAAKDALAKTKKKFPLPMLRLAVIFHPHWSSSADHALLKAKASGSNFSIIADRLGCQRVAVEQRWHRLRIIPDIVKKLEAFGLTSAPYPMNGGQQ